jgi:hypothetical protein
MYVCSVQRFFLFAFAKGVSLFDLSQWETLLLQRRTLEMKQSEMTFLSRVSENVFVCLVKRARGFGLCRVHMGWSYGKGT